MGTFDCNKVRQAQAEGRQAAYLQHVSTSMPVTTSLCGADEAKHENAA
jgi:hypothetical protein